MYLYQYYTSVGVYRELRKEGMFVTSTVMANRIPAQLRLTNSKLKEMERGACTFHWYTFEVNDKEQVGIGLTCW